VVNTVKLIFGSVGLFVDYLGEISVQVGIPTFITGFIFTVIIIISITSFINFVSGRSKL